MENLGSWNQMNISVVEKLNLDKLIYSSLNFYSLKISECNWYLDAFEVSEFKCAEGFILCLFQKSLMLDKEIERVSGSYK